MTEPLRIGTRGSQLALTQTALIAALLETHLAGREIEIKVLSVSGDRNRAGTSGSGPTDKRRWVDTIEAALLEHAIDLAVHSAKDVPGEISEGLTLLGAPTRAPAYDCLCGAGSLESLPSGGRVGTSSLRRAAQLRACRRDLEIIEIAGNVDTRLRKLEQDKEWDAIVLAFAGLQRLGRESSAGGALDPMHFVPAPGQGTLALQGRLADESTELAVNAIADTESLACLLAERALALGLQADCHTPVGAHATPDGEGRLRMRAWVGLPDGSEWASDELDGSLSEPEALGRLVAERLQSAGAAELLRRAGEMAAVGGV